MKKKTYVYVYVRVGISVSSATASNKFSSQTDPFRNVRLQRHTILFAIPAEIENKFKKCETLTRKSLHRERYGNRPKL
uniref:CSON007048 protein n=1 Tax=Culicoides sonorensis TaxID=179676 RepID=A0A336MYX1_CULSO